jgi:hypothetical protein
MLRAPYHVFCRATQNMFAIPLEAALHSAQPDAVR